jgi:hypothetical protein
MRHFLLKKKVWKNTDREMQIRNGIELERCGQVRATKPRSGSGPVEWERYYILGGIYLGQMGKIK